MRIQNDQILHTIPRNTLSNTAAWLTATAYVVNDTVYAQGFDTGLTYVFTCSTAHTSAAWDEAQETANWTRGALDYPHDSIPFDTGSFFDYTLLPESRAISPRVDPRPVAGMVGRILFAPQLYPVPTAEWQPSTTYALGDPCSHIELASGLAYDWTATTGHTSAATWTTAEEANWTRGIIAQVLYPDFTFCQTEVGLFYPVGQCIATVIVTGDETTAGAPTFVVFYERVNTDNDHAKQEQLTITTGNVISETTTDMQTNAAIHIWLNGVLHFIGIAPNFFTVTGPRQIAWDRAAAGYDLSLTNDIVVISYY